MSRYYYSTWSDGRLVRAIFQFQRMVAAEAAQAEKLDPILAESHVTQAAYLALALQSHLDELKARGLELPELEPVRTFALYPCRFGASWPRELWDISDGEGDPAKCRVVLSPVLAPSATPATNSIQALAEYIGEQLGVRVFWLIPDKRGPEMPSRVFFVDLDRVGDRFVFSLLEVAEGDAGIVPVSVPRIDVG